MKFNLKSWLLGAAATLCGFVSTNAATLQFSTEDAPVWYQIRFYKGDAAIADQNAGNNLRTAASNASADEQLWQLIGDADSFVLKSKKGNYVTFSDKFKTGSTPTPLYAVTAGDNYEIGRVGSTKHFNQWGGSGAGKEIGEWDTNDVNNPLNFYDTSGTKVTIVQEGKLPEFSTDAKSAYYYLKFLNGGNVMEATASGQSIIRAAASPVPSKRFKLVGNRDNFQIVSESGLYIDVTGKGDGGVKASASPIDGGFSLVAYIGSNYAKTWQLKPNKYNDADNKNYVNQFGGTTVGGKFGLWVPNDVNNAMTFIAPDDMTFGEFTVEGTTSWQPANAETLWYTSPGSWWMDWALPIGNGRFGAQILGGVNEEEISFTEKTLWSGKSTDHGSSNYTGYGSFQGFGNLMINAVIDDQMPFGWDADKAVKNYHRSLDLTTATADVYFEDARGNQYKREFIASYPDGVVAIHLTASTPGTLSQTFSFQPGVQHTNGNFNDTNDDLRYADGYGRFNGNLETVSYAATFKVVPTGGTMVSTDKGITVTGADEILVILAGTTDYDPVSPTYTSGTSALVETVNAMADNAAQKGWNAIYADHLADYQALYGRVSLAIDGADTSKTTLDLINQYNRGQGPAGVCRQLEQLYFQYGRYLALGSSRGIAVPNNLQGIWTGYNKNRWHSGSNVQPWNADIHANINIEMNYWPTEPTNIAEAHEPYLDYIINMATVQPQWRENPSKFVTNPKGSKGWSIFNENNIFGAGSSWGNNYVVGNAWYCTHLWTHYEFTQDKEFLARALPTMWGACEFWIERLKLAGGEYLCPNEASPEHGPNEDGVAHAQQIVAELFNNTLAAIEIIGEDNCGISKTDIETLRERNSKLDRGLHTEPFTAASGWTANGLSKDDPLLREWKTSPYTAGQNGHRHLSHLMCLFPFGQVSPSSEFFTAAVNSLRQRGDGATGWSMGWKINLWARAQDGDHTHTILKNALTDGIYKNLYDKHAPFQIDGNFGATSGIAEMLLQSHDGLHLLPALPTAWKGGEVKGLKARGNYTVDIKWADNKVETAKVLSNKGGDLKFRAAEIEHLRISLNGQEVKDPEITIGGAQKAKFINFKGLNEGDVLEFVYDSEYTNPNVKNDDSAIEEALALKSGICVSNGKVIAPQAQSLIAYDAEGRRIASAKASELALGAKGVIIIKATMADGSIETLKTII